MIICPATLKAKMPSEAAARFDAAPAETTCPTRMVVVAGSSSFTKSTPAMGSEATKKENPSQISFESFVLDEDDAIAFATRPFATCAFATLL